MGRRPNTELRKLVASLYLAGLSYEAIAREVALRLGKRYSTSYLRKLVWEMKKRGQLGQASWEELFLSLRAIKILVTDLEELLRSPTPPPKKELLDRVNRLRVHCDDALTRFHLLRMVHDRGALRGVRYV